MALEMLEKIREAEKQASEVTASAQSEAREMIKSVQEACLEREHQENANLRTLYQDGMEQAERNAKRAIDEERLQNDREIQQMIDNGRTNILQAAEMIFERIVENGNR